MNDIPNKSSSEIEEYLKRIADALELANQETIDIIKKASNEVDEEKEELKNLKPEERFIFYVDRLNKDFQKIVHSFAEGEAHNVNFMEKYPFASFSLMQLAEAVNEWSNSLRIVNKVEEDKKRKKQETEKEG